MVTDHTGKEFATQADMARAWGIRPRLFIARMTRGWDVERALTAPLQRTCAHSIKCTDHTGRQFGSRSAMARAWGIPFVTLRERLSAGWSLERALTAPRTGQRVPARDHRGRKYPSLSAMALDWGITPSMLRHRLDDGWSLRKALTTPSTRPDYEATDHLGRHYRTMGDMCRAWGVPYSTFLKRRAHGWGLAESLERFPFKGNLKDGGEGWK